MMENVTTILLVQLLLKLTERCRIILCQNMSKPFSFSLSNVSCVAAISIVLVKYGSISWYSAISTTKLRSRHA